MIIPWLVNIRDKSARDNILEHIREGNLRQIRLAVAASLCTLMRKVRQPCCMSSFGQSPSLTLTRLSGLTFTPARQRRSRTL